MKRIVALVLCAVFSFSLLFLYSCDYQDQVDSARSDLMETAKDLLDPFLNQTNSEIDNSDINDVNSSQDNGTQNVESKE